MKLTMNEKKIIIDLGNCFKQFLALDEHHPNDPEDFASHIHILQRQVMARLARREHPEVFKRTGRLE